MSTRDSIRRGRPVDQAKHDAILAAARTAFFDDGFDGTSIEAIAARAGVSKVTIYSHYKDKTELFACCVERECEHMRGALVFDSDAGPLKDQLIRFGEVMVAFLTRPDLIRFDRHLSGAVEHNPELGRTFLEAGPLRVHRALAAVLNEARARGDIAIDDPELAAELLMSMFKGLSDLHNRFAGSSDPVQAQRRVEAAVALFLRASAPRSEAERA